MEVIHKAPKLIAPQEEDFITTMPDNVLTNILDRLPLQDAVRTGVLARSWRYNWTMLSQLVFDSNFFRYLSQKEVEKKDYGRIISRVLMHIKGAITKFVLYIDGMCLDADDINQWFLVLSNKGVKDVTLWKRNVPPLKLPTQLFSCLELKHLKLYQCCFNPPASFHGFPNLLSLELTFVLLSKIFGKFFTQSPIPEFLNLRVDYVMGRVKLDEIAKVGNLKKLSLNLFNLECMRITSSSGIFDLVGSLPKLQELVLEFPRCKSFTIDGAGKSSSTIFPCLKALKLTRIDLGNGNMLAFAFELIRGSPNLQILEITASECKIDPAPANSFLEVDYNIVSPLQLRRAVFEDFKGSENEACLVKYLITSSPFLKRIVIRTLSFVVSHQKFLFAKMLLKLQQAYPDVVIDLH